MTTELQEKNTNPSAGAVPRNQTRIRPVADVYRNSDDVRILLDLPGAAESDVEVETHDGVLTVAARVERGEENLRLYERSFRLDQKMDVQAIQASLRQGVLTLRIPYREEARPRRIEVRAS